jgi:6-pyruvoyltetrahydropterin/6-carboxytetrahydropterin synthase
MKAYLNRRYVFSAAHRLQVDLLSEAENRELYGKCNNPYGHGHNYVVTVTVSGQVNAKTGMVCNLADLDACVKQQVVERYDHRNLNCLPEFQQVVPTTENLCVAIYEIVKREFHAAHLEKVRIDETMMNSFEYAGDAGPRH